MKDPVTGWGTDPIHGMTGTPTYESWRKMIQRCTNPNAEQFKYYGKRGIKVAPSWFRFEAFFADMGKRPKGKTLSRIDNDGNYEKSNCEWADHQSQMWNRSNTNWFVVEGKSVPLVEAARQLSVWPNSLRQKLKLGWDKKRIVSFYKQKT